MKKRSFGWFLFGLGGQLQIVASLSFTELFVFVAAPLLFLKELPHLKKNGMMPLLWLAVFVTFGCAFACIANHTAFKYALRGLAVTSLLPCTIVVGHWMLRRDMGGFKWMLVGSAISSVLSTFVFQKAVEVAMLAGGQSGSDAVEAIMAGPIYWINRIGSIAQVYPSGWYLHCPAAMSVGLPMAMAFFSILTSVSGRSVFVSSLAMAVIVFLGGKKSSTIRKNICQRFWLLVVLGIVGLLVLKGAYSISAESGWLGEESRQKYERQTQGDKSFKALLLGGRMESFCGLIACVDKPIIGFGPWAMDHNGYVEEFLRKYATYEDYENYLKLIQFYRHYGVNFEPVIPCHAYITEFWCWYGISGLLFWLYVIFVLIRYLRQDCWAVPQWFMWLAATIPGYFWGIFFSPWSSRVSGVLLIVACLMTRAVRMGKQLLPGDMLSEIESVERIK